MVDQSDMSVLRRLREKAVFQLLERKKQQKKIMNKSNVKFYSQFNMDVHTHEHTNGNNKILLHLNPEFSNLKIFCVFKFDNR